MAEEWPRVEEAARIACRALRVATTVAPPLRNVPPGEGELVVGELRIDPRSRRQWWGEAEFELTPLQQRLLAVMAREPYRLFGTDELRRLVWQRSGTRASAVKTSVGRLRRTLEMAGAPRGRFLLSLHGVGWSLTRPD
jgi:DNA-binding response OmpR family regulator